MIIFMRQLLTKTRKGLKHIFLHTLDCGGADLRRFGSPLSYSPMFSDGIMYFDGKDLVRRGPNGGLSSYPGMINFDVIYSFKDTFQDEICLECTKRSKR